jgi:hypothetical protein
MVFRSRKLKDRQFNDLKKKDKKTNKDLHKFWSEFLEYKFWTRPRKFYIPNSQKYLIMIYWWTITTYIWYFMLIYADLNCKQWKYVREHQSGSQNNVQFTFY